MKIFTKLIKNNYEENSVKYHDILNFYHLKRGKYFKKLQIFGTRSYPTVGGGNFPPVFCWKFNSEQLLF